MTQIDQLKTDNVRLEEELNLTRQENTNETAHADTYKANLKDKLLNLQQENKLLKSQLETKFNEENFSAEQQLGDAQRQEKTLEAKNKALEERIAQLEERLEKAGGSGDAVDSYTTQKLQNQLQDQKRQTLGLIQQVDAKCEEIEKLEKAAASHVLEKSEL